MSDASLAPVVIVGCPRSGTTLLYHMLLSSGNFAIFRAESNVFNFILPRFRNLRSTRTRRNLLASWLTTRQWQRSGLDVSPFRHRVLTECRSIGDFLRIFMESIARAQGVDRWADCTPEHLLYASKIKREIPNARIIHIIRDGRDVALSLAKQEWISPLPGDHAPHHLIAGIYWEWIVSQGRKQGRELGTGYLEVRFEALVNQPRIVLPRIERFIGHPLDYERIQAVGIGSVGRPNTSFNQDDGTSSRSPIGRWRALLSPPDIAALENVLGDSLIELGYPLATRCDRRTAVYPNVRRVLYHSFFSSKQWLKTRWPSVRRLVDLLRLQECR